VVNGRAESCSSAARLCRFARLALDSAYQRGELIKPEPALEDQAMR
jgi:hypothetical protein